MARGSTQSTTHSAGEAEAMPDGLYGSLRDVSTTEHLTLDVFIPLAFPMIERPRQNELVLCIRRKELSMSEPDVTRESNHKGI